MEIFCRKYLVDSSLCVFLFYKKETLFKTYFGRILNYCIFISNRSVCQNRVVHIA